MICPFARVLSNFVSVCLATIHNFFEDRKNFIFEYEDSELVCYTKMLQTMSSFDDWTSHLGLLLQSILFLDEALLTHDRFIEIFKNFIEDNRCEVHQTVLGIREGSEGWFEMFCLVGIACDDCELFSLMFGDVSFELISEDLSRLLVLNLRETPVTDKGLAYLVCMKMLRKVNLNSTHLSPLTFELISF